MIKEPDELSKEEIEELQDYCTRHCYGCYFSDNCIFDEWCNNIILPVDMDYKSKQGGC
ncbi:hypothetical protein KAR91_41175 [Candidatus Pacearchaeota archaeon]|nr:hypothetical protein [Candidatus Pacearchaeota archaeon]